MFNVKIGSFDRDRLLKVISSPLIQLLVIKHLNSNEKTLFGQTRRRSPTWSLLWFTMHVFKHNSSFAESFFISTVRCSISLPIRSYLIPTMCHYPSRGSHFLPFSLSPTPQCNTSPFGSQFKYKCNSELQSSSCNTKSITQYNTHHATHTTCAIHPGPIFLLTRTNLRK